MAIKAWGIKAKNYGQEEALKYLLDASIDLVVLQGIAGSGKTLLALAAGLEQVVENHMYKEIIFTRAPVPVGDDMGFLPGEEKDKMAPWCAALFDNLEQLVGDSKLTDSIVQTKIKIRAMCYLRGSSFNNKFLIVDEMQNLSIKQVKVLISRAGEGCKVVCLGDNEQIDNKKLNIDNNGLALLIKAAEGCDFIKVIQMPDCERSRLAGWAANNL